MLKWMVPKPNRMLRRSRNGLGDRVLARHSLSPQQVSQEGTLTYLLPVRGENETWKSSFLVWKCWPVCWLILIRRHPCIWYI